jgi:hypothetical protein
MPATARRGSGRLGVRVRYPKADPPPFPESRVIPRRLSLIRVSVERGRDKSPQFGGGGAAADGGLAGWPPLADTCGGCVCSDIRTSLIRSPLGGGWRERSDAFCRGFGFRNAWTTLPDVRIKGDTPDAPRTGVISGSSVKRWSSVRSGRYAERLPKASRHTAPLRRRDAHAASTYPKVQTACGTAYVVASVPHPPGWGCSTVRWLIVERIFAPDSLMRDR